MQQRIWIAVLTLWALTLAVSAQEYVDKPSKDQLHKWKKFHPGQEKTAEPLASRRQVHISEDSNTDKDDALDRASLEEDKLHIRVTRQTGEKRGYYPCMTCFQLGTREMCTKPHCPEGHDCDKSSRRCHKKANTGVNSRNRSRPGQQEPEEVEEEQAPPPSPPQPTRTRG